MRKFLVIPLLFFYALAVSGISIHAHYCGKHLLSWSLYTKGKDCGGCEKEKKKSCCKDKVVSIKVSQEQKKVSAFHFKLLQAYADIIHSVNSDHRGCTLYSIKPCTHLSNAPPGLWQDIPLYKLNSSLTYYS